MDLLSAERQLQAALQHLREKQTVDAAELNALSSVKNKLNGIVGDKGDNRRQRHASMNPPFKLTEPLLSATTFEEVNAQLSRFTTTLVARLQETEQLFKSAVLKQSAGHDDLNRLTLSAFQTALPVDKLCILFRNTRFSSFNFSEFAVGKGDIGPAFTTLENLLNDLEGELSFLELDGPARRALAGQLHFNSEDALYGCVQVTLPEVTEYTETKAIFLFVAQRDCKHVFSSLYESEVLKSFIRTLHLSAVKLHLDFHGGRLNREVLSDRGSKVRNLLSVNAVLLLDFAVSVSPAARFSLRWRNCRNPPDGISVVPLTDSEWEIAMLAADSRKADGAAAIDRTFQAFLSWLREDTCASVNSLWRPDSLFLIQVSQVGVVQRVKLAEERGLILKHVVPDFQPNLSLFSYLDPKVAKLIEEAISEQLLAAETKRETAVMFSQVKYKVGWLSPIDGQAVSEGAQFYVLASPSLNAEKRGSVKIALNLAEELA